MQFKQFYLGCLAHASYYLGSGAEAVVIDPQRDVDQYIREAETNGQRIKYVIETHSHADFVSGHLELAERSGAEIVFGQRANTEFPSHKVKDGDELWVEKIKLKFLETPGHTPESITILAQETEDVNQPLKMFTGDTLFIGDVGRPDLIGSKGFTAEQMAAQLYDSIHNKILPLSDETEVYPAHGAGSLCGKSLSKETWSTLGEQRRTNYALKLGSKEEFVNAVACDQPEVPAYFPVSSAQNLKGSIALEDLPKPKELSTEEIENFDGVLIDVRPNSEFGAGHVPNSINIGLGGQFATWAGTFVSIGTPVAIVAETHNQVDEAVMRLARVGIETAKGFILIKNYRGETKQIEQISVENVKERLANDIQFVDVRRVAEYDGVHAEKTMNIPLNKVTRQLDHLNPSKPTYVICQSGYRSSLATSIFENAGFKQVYNVQGGTNAWVEAKLKTEVSTAVGVAS
jgi:glyoxylase-like metal-dependent hydrolase (beta-lactamase superfamily II)/rhodanese-related sulfurtransferase